MSDREKTMGALQRLFKRIEHAEQRAQRAEAENAELRKRNRQLRRVAGLDPEDAPHTPEQAHGDALAAMQRLEWPADYEGREADIRTVLQALTASGVPYGPESIVQLVNEFRHDEGLTAFMSPDDVANECADRLERAIAAAPQRGGE